MRYRRYKNIKKTIAKFLIMTFIVNIIFMIYDKNVEGIENEGWETVRISCGINNSLWIDNNGEVKGYCAEYINELSKINHWNMVYVNCTWNEAVQKLNDGEIDIIFPAQKSEERENTMKFSDVIGGYQQIALFASEESDIFYEDYQSFNGKRIAVTKGSSNEITLRKYADEHGFSYTPVYVDSTEEKLVLINNGKADMAVFSTINNADNLDVVAILDYLPFYYAVSIDNEEILEEMNYAMKQLLTKQPQLVSNTFQKVLTDGVTTAFTREENEVINNTDKIVVGMYKDTSPLSDVNKNGKGYGIYCDILNKLEDNIGIKIDIYMIDRDEYAYDLVKNGTIDFLIGSSDKQLQALDNDYYISTDSVMEYSTVAVTRKNYVFSEESKPKFALTSARKYWKPYILERFPGARITYYKSAKDCLIAVQNGETDSTLLNTWEFNYQSKNSRFSELIEWENFRISSNMVMVTTNDKDDKLVAVINKGISQISTDDINEIVTYYLNMPYSSYDFNDKLYSMKWPIIIVSGVFLATLITLIVYIYVKKKYVNKLEENNLKLVKANEAKTSFLSRMSHELRTPLNVITGYTTLMEEDYENKRNNTNHENISAIKNSTKYLLALIDDILDTQKIEKGKIELVKEKVNAEEYMNNIVNMIKPEAETKNITFVYKRLTKIEENYIGDGVRIEQILLNILHNAVKFTPKGGKVSLTAEAVEHDEFHTTLKFVIKDTGIGMTKEYVDKKLFTMFSQEDTNTTSPYEGTGLGLAISKELAKLMNGDITCESVKGLGSTFTIQIVVDNVQNDIDNTKDNDKMDVYNLNNINVLICEDNYVNQEITKALLEMMNCNIDIAENGKIGLQKYLQSDNNYYDVILMDIRMPLMDGFEATKKIRLSGRKDSTTIPILALSANAFEKDRKKSIEAGMNEHMAKPVDARVLYTMIKKYCK